MFDFQILRIAAGHQVIVRKACAILIELIRHRIRDIEDARRQKGPIINNSYLL